MHLSAALLLLFIAVVAFSDANPVVRFHRIDRFLRSHDESLFDDEDVTGNKPSPEIPRDRAIPELDIDEDINDEDDSFSLRRRRTVVGVAPPAAVLPIENEETSSSEESQENGRRRRELREDENEDEEEVVGGGTPPPFLPSPADEDLGPLWVRLRRQSSLPKDDTEMSSSSESEEDDNNAGAHRLPRHVGRRQKRVRKSLRRRDTGCADGSCSEESSESRSNEMTSLQPEDTTDRPLVRRYRDLDSNTEETTGEDLDKQIGADDEGALRMPRHAEKDISASRSVEQELDAAIQSGPDELNNEGGEGNAGLLRRRRRHRHHNFHHRHHKQVQKQKRHARGLHSFALPGKAGRPAVTDEEGWMMDAEEAKRNNHRILG